MVYRKITFENDATCWKHERIIPLLVQTTNILRVEEFGVIMGPQQQEQAQVFLMGESGDC